MYCLVLLSALLACAAGVPLDTTKPRSDERSVGGNVADITNHPYQVSVLDGGSFTCSGSIISANWVVTLAQCVEGSVTSSLTVQVGSNYSSYGGTLHRATTIIRHESYNPNNYNDYDVAVVQVFPDFTFSDSVQPITLECDPVPAGTDVVLTGWVPTLSIHKPLDEVNLKTISDSSCNSTYDGHITDHMICTGDPNGGKGACGDFGGPLVASNKLVGIYSWGESCGNPQYPDVYTKVSAVCDWIAISTGLYKLSAVIN